MKKETILDALKEKHGKIRHIIRLFKAVYIRGVYMFAFIIGAQYGAFCGLVEAFKRAVNGTAKR